jgi:hypothetical protein
VLEWGNFTGTLSDQTDLQNALDSKQATLVSGTNLKTVNGNSLLGSGDLVVGGGSSAWGDLTGVPQTIQDIEGLSEVAGNVVGWSSGSLANVALADVATSGSYGDLSGTPSLATVATSGDYDDLSGTPSLATVATSGDYDDLTNRPNMALYGQLTNNQTWSGVNTFTGAATFTADGVFRGDLYLTTPASGNAVFWLGLEGPPLDTSVPHSVMYWTESSDQLRFEARNGSGTPMSSLYLETAKDNALFNCPVTAKAFCNIYSAAPNGFSFAMFGESDGLGGINTTSAPWGRLYHWGTAQAMYLQSFNGGAVVGELQVANGSINVSHGINYLSYWNGNPIKFGWDGTAIRVSVDASELGVMSISAPSSRQFKREISELGYGLEAIEQLEPVRFKWDADHLKTQYGEGWQLGLIAEDVAQVLPELVKDIQTNQNTEDTYPIVDYVQFVPVAISAIKELKGQLSEAQSQLSEAQSELAILRREMNAVLLTVGLDPING